MMILTASVAPLLLAASPAAAQSASKAAPSDNTLGEVVVTALKRESTVQKTPIAISVVTSAELQRQGVHDMESLASIEPDLNFREGAGLPVITIRGISSDDVSEVGDPAVAVSTDGVVLNRPYALNASLYDLDRVEVLRGPQGTLSGRSAVGGAINFITAQPEKTDKGFASLTLGDYNTVNTEGMANLALSDKVQLRLSGMTRYDDGYRAIPPFGRADDDVSQSARATLAFQPTDRLTTTATVEFTHLGGAGEAQQYLPLVYHNGAVVHERPVIPSYSSFPAGAQPRLSTTELATRWKANYALDWATITYIGGFDVINYRQAYFSDLAPTSTYNYNEHPQTVNQEIHVASRDDQRLTWLVGSYFFNEVNDLFDFTRRPGVGGVQVRGNTYQYTTNAQSIAGFGSASYALTDTLKLTGGIRYSHDEKARSGDTYTANVKVSPVTYAPLSAAGHATFSQITYDAKLEWQATARNLVYAKFDTGYKPGGFTNVNDYGAETVDAYEIGAKNRFLGGRLQFNIAAFYESYHNQQLTQSVTVGDRIFQEVLNAGRSTIYGVEPDISVEIPEVGQIDLNGQYLHARLTDFLNLGVQYAGNQLPQAPDFTLSAGWSRNFPTRIGVFRAEVRTKLQTKSYLDYTNYGEQEQDGYSTTNIDLSYKPNSGRWQMELFARNLEDRQILLEAAVNTYANSYRFSYAAPRTYGGKLSVWF
jgi:iron complex outermembrane receptor protein